MTLARLLLPCAVLALASGAHAQRTGDGANAQPRQKGQSQSQETPAVARPTTPAPAAPPATDTAPRERALSPAMSAALADRMPKYNPPPPPREPTPEEIAASQPKNQIIRLPEVVVQERRSPAFTDRDIHTKQGMAAMAVNRYLSELDRGVLNRYTLPLFGQSQEQRALAAYAEEERLRNMDTASDRAQAIEASEGADAARAFRDTTNSTFIRTPYLPEPNSLKRD